MPTSLLRALAALAGAVLLVASPATRAEGSDAGPELDPALDVRLKEVTLPSQGAMAIGGRRVEYRAVAGLLQVDDSKQEPSAVMSYAAYFGKVAAGAPARPVIFLYNGGPGSSTVWLHVGAFGPKRVLTGNGQAGPPAPYRLVDNEHSLLDVADLVFVDAPGTGFGRIVAVDRVKSKEREKLKEKEKEFWGVDQDAQAFARFIKKFMARHGLWNAPKFLFGESYGTTRTAVLAQVLHEQEGVDVNGIMLLSQVLNFALGADEPQHNPGVDLPYALALPTFAATAWYHRKLPAWSDRSPQTLERLVAETRRFALEEYLPALQAGAGLEPARRRSLAERLASLIGLKPDYLEKAELRVNGGTFGNQLLADEGLTVGRLDSRYSGASLDRLAKEWAYDPQSSAITSAYVSAYNDYARRVLGFDADREYRLYAEVFKVWDFRHKPPGVTEPMPGLVNVMPDLATVMRTQPRLKVATFMGYFDLATPFFAAEYELSQLPIPPALRANLELHLFPAGHMMYDDPASLKALHDHIANFVHDSSSGR